MNTSTTFYTAIEIFGGFTTFITLSHWPTPLLRNIKSKAIYLYNTFARINKNYLWPVPVITY